MFRFHQALSAAIGVCCLLTLSFTGMAQNNPPFSLVVQSGHTSSVRQIITSDNLMVTQSGFSDIKVWDLQSGLELFKIPMSRYALQPYLSYHPGRNEIAVCSSSIGLYDLASGKLKRSFRVSEKDLSISGVMYSPVSPAIMTVEYVNSENVSKVYLYSSEKEVTPKSLGTVPGYFNSMTVSADGKWLAVGTRDFAAVFETASGKKVFEQNVTTGALAFSRDGQKLYAASPNGFYGDVRYKYYMAAGLYVFNFKKGEVLQHVRLTSPRAVAISPDESMVAVAANNGVIADKGENDITILKLSDFSILKTFTTEQSQIATMSLAFDKSGKILITGNSAGDVTFLSTVTWLPARKANKVKRESPLSMAFVDGGKKLLATFSHYGLVWDLQNLRIAYSFVHNPNLESYVSVDFLVSPDGKYILTGTNDRVIKVWEASTGKLVHSRKFTLGSKELTYALPLKFMSESVVKIDLRGSGGYNESYTGYNIFTNTEVYLRHTDGVTSADGKFTAKQGYIANAKDRFEYGKDYLTVYDASGTEIKRFDYGRFPEFSPTGSLLKFDYDFMGAAKEFPGFTAYGELYDLTNNKSVFKDEGYSGFSANGRFLYHYKSGETSSDIYSSPDCKFLVKLDHGTTVGNHVFSPDDKFVAVTSEAGILVYDLATGKRVANMVSIGQEIFAVVNGDGYYKAHPKAYGSIAFRQGLRAYPFEQFDLRFNRPHAVMESFPFADHGLLTVYRQAYEKRLRKMGLTPTEVEGELQMPEVAVTSAVPLSTQGAELPLTIKASDAKYDLKRLNVLVNGVPIFGSAGQSLVGKQVDRSFNVRLVPGANKVQVSVMNSKGVESLIQEFNVTCNAAKAKPDVYVLSMGVSEFEDQSYNLTYAAKDAKDLAALYKSSNRFNKVKTLTLSNGDVVKSAMMKAKMFLKDAREEDLVVVHIATHGLLDDNFNYYLATTDVDFNNPSVAGLAYEDFESLFDDVRSRQKLVMIDACHSGEIDKEESVLTTTSVASAKGVNARGFKGVKSKNGPGLVNSYELMRELFADIRRGTGAIVISSASGKEYAFESEAWKNGVFTYAVINGLQSGEADANRDGRVVVSELRDYVTQKVVALTEGKQHPTSRNDNLEADFEVW